MDISEEGLGSLLALLNSPVEENIELGLMLWRAQPHPLIDERLQAISEVLLLPDALEDLRAGENEDLIEMWLRRRVHIGDLGRVRAATSIFSQTYYAWGGQSFGYDESPANIRSMVQESLIREGLVDWMRAQADSEARQKYTERLLQWWVSHRVVELRPLVAYIGEYWQEEYHAWYHVGEIYLEEQNYELAAEALWRYIKEAEQRNEPIALRSRLHRRTEYKRHYHEEEEAHLLPNGQWYWLGFDFCYDLGSHPHYHGLPPNLIESYEMLADIAAQRGEMEAAEAYLRKSISFCPTHWLAPRLKLGQLLLQRGKYEEAWGQLLAYWEGLRAETPNRRYIRFGGWHSWSEEYPLLIAYLLKRYPLLHMQGDWWWLAEKYYAAAEYLQRQKVHKQGVLRLIAAACDMLAKLFDLLQASDLYHKMPYKGVAAWQESADLPRRLFRALQQWGAARRRSTLRLRLSAVTTLLDAVYTLLEKYEQARKNKSISATYKEQAILLPLPALAVDIFRYKLQLLQLYYRDWWQIRVLQRKYPLIEKYRQTPNMLQESSDAKRFWRYLKVKSIFK